MTRKGYVRLAHDLAHAFFVGKLTKPQMARIQGAVAASLHIDNPAFEGAKFHDAIALHIIRLKESNT